MKRLATCGVALSVAACATAPDKIQATYVSPIQYSGYDCDQIRMELERVTGRVREVAGAQKRQANNDAIAMGVGLVVFWPALFFLAGGNDRKEELASLKGSYDALTQAAILKKCSYSQELRQAAAPPPAVAAVAAAPAVAPVPTPAPAPVPVSTAPAPAAAPQAKPCGMIKQRDGSMMMVPCA